MGCLISAPEPAKEPAKEPSEIRDCESPIPYDKREAKKVYLGSGRDWSELGFDGRTRYERRQYKRLGNTEIGLAVCDSWGGKELYVYIWRVEYGWMYDNILMSRTLGSVFGTTPRERLDWTLVESECNLLLKDNFSEADDIRGTAVEKELKDINSGLKALGGTAAAEAKDALRALQGVSDAIKHLVAAKDRATIEKEFEAIANEVKAPEPSAPSGLQ